jgi:hypothetical protein
MIPVERAVHDGGPDFPHQMSAPRTSAFDAGHSFADAAAIALGDCRLYRFFTATGCRVVDDHVGFSGHISLDITQEARPLACVGCAARIIGCNVHCNDGFGDETQRAFDLTMPETPSDPFDRLGEDQPGEQSPWCRARA